MGKRLTLKEAYLYSSLNGKVQCHLCGRRCTIPDGGVGFCGVRKNLDGKLYSLVYGKAVAAAADPIMKKPLYHFHPGSSVMSIATIGCNFRCKYCDNWVISQDREVKGMDLPPDRVVQLALEYDCQGISYTYTEPTIFMEYAYDTAKIAKEKGLFNTFVTNGYMTPEAVEFISPFLDAATVDFKGSANPEFYKTMAAVPDVEPIYECLKALKSRNVHIEITDLIVTKYGDSMEDLKTLATWIKDNLGPDTPFHILRFHPDYKLTDVPSTPLNTLEKAYETAKDVGLHYVYLGNVPGHKYEHTYCPNCGERVIERYGFYISRWLLTKDKKCPSCGWSIPIRGVYHPGGLEYHMPVI
jgi:pyruvate formate lyase activating enzyme